MLSGIYHQSTITSENILKKMEELRKALEDAEKKRGEEEYGYYFPKAGIAIVPNSWRKD